MLQDVFVLGTLPRPLCIDFSVCNSTSLNIDCCMHKKIWCSPARVFIRNHLHLDLTLQVGSKRLASWNLLTCYNILTSIHTHAQLLWRRKSFIFISCSSDWLYANEFVLGVRNCRGKKNFAPRPRNYFSHCSSGPPVQTHLHTANQRPRLSISYSFA